MNRHGSRVASLVLIMAAGLTGCSGCNGPAPIVAQDQAAAPAVEHVVTVRPERKTFTLSTTQPGRIEAFEETPLFAKLAGYAEQVLVDIGDTVEKDQTLIKLSIPELRDELAQKQALVAQAEAQIRQAVAGLAAARAAVETAQAKMVEAEAGIARADAELGRWQSEHARMQDLAGKGSVTKKLLEETTSQLRSAEATQREVQAKAQSAKSAAYEVKANVAKAEADFAAAEARLQVAQADRARAETMLRYIEIKAPYAARVTRRMVDTGHFVHPAGGGNDKPLMTVARVDSVRIFVDVPELEAPLVDAGDPAEVRVQALAPKGFTAQVTRSSWSLSEVNRSLRVEIDVPNAEGLLRAGMYAMATIQLAQHPQALVVPTSAVAREGDQHFVASVESGAIVRKTVELGLHNAHEAEILSGLTGDETLVLKQPAVYKPGQQVSVAPPAQQ